jgi:two-component system, NarL family, sensor histidine kinase UhpB
MPRQTLLRRVFSANALVLVTAVALLALLPVTVSWPVNAGEALVLAAGLLVMLATNLVLTRRVLMPLGRLRHAMATVDPLHLGGAVDVGARSVEIAELTATFNDMLRRLDHERRDSARRTQSAQERERRAISLELHDQVGQNLTALLLQLDVASRFATTPAQQSALETSLQTVRDCLEQVRSVVRRLRPEALDDLGLVGALEHLCDRVGHDTGLLVDRSLDHEIPALSPDAQLVVYRITQESLTNAVRHSGAGRVLVRLEQACGGARLTVTDDGAGMPDGAAEGSGIRGMRERSLMVGAALRVVPRRPSGTSVTLEIPAAEARA